MPHPLRQFALLAHVVLSVGWLGAAIAYLALAVAGVVSHDPRLIQAVYPSMELIGGYVLVPCALATLGGGVVQAVVTRWGLFRHWWVLAKFGLTLLGAMILVAHMHDVSRVARATAATPADIDFRPELLHAAGGVLVLLTAAALSVLKPWGMTPWARRRHASAIPVSRHRAGVETAPPSGSGGAAPGRLGLVLGVHAAVLVLLLAVLHLAGAHPH